MRRQGLEPRTRGLRVDRWAAADALPARIAHVNAPEAPNTRAFGWCSFHDPFHGPMASTAGCITESHRSASARLAPVEKDAGLTLGMTEADADRAQLGYSYLAARITLLVNSALAKIGLTESVSRVLAGTGISCNVIAGAAHDQLPRGPAPAISRSGT